MTPDSTLSRRARADVLGAHLQRRLEIERLADTAIDLDIALHDARVELEAAVRRLQQAVRDREAVALRLAALDAPEAA